MDIFDKLANFNRPKLKHSIGVYISLENICAAEVRFVDDEIKVERFVKAPIPQPKKTEAEGTRAAALNTSFFLNEANWLAPLHKAASQVEWNTRKVIVTLSPQFAVFRHFVMPYVERRFWQQSIPLESKKYVPFAFEESMYDFYVYNYDNTAESKGKLGVLFALTSKKVSEAVSAGIKKLGLEMVSMEVSALSVDRLFSMADGGEGGKIYAHFDANTAYVLLSNNGVPLLSREINFTDSQTTERRRLDLRGSIEFVTKQLGSQVFKEIKMSGDNLDLWKVILEEDSRLPAVVWEPSKQLKLAEKDWALYSAAGACAKLLGYEAADVELAAKVESMDHRKALVIVWGLAFAMIAFMLLAAVYQHFKVAGLKREYVKAQAAGIEVPEFKGKSAADIKSRVETMRIKTQALAGVLDNRDFLIPKLQAAADAIPAQLWLQDIAYGDPVPVASQNRENLFQLKGAVKAGNPNADIEAVKKYKEDFRKEEAVSLAYGSEDAKVELDYQVGGTKAENEKNPYTTFTIKCSKQTGGQNGGR